MNSRRPGEDAAIPSWKEDESVVNEEYLPTELKVCKQLLSQGLTFTIVI